ncbi:MFS general substrate transporter [Karstenula rhodostoma CBS 690.94]|uniref:MFS general substrate transporter n=1 Tax=Karstenula rhodostoma CBS 690.94 TaxID=1392251 RepID=A0A9P4U7I1_9PLEO|nr:MFS general substrate transporter [Karstenula rhodostoma CBS 690.94]
MASSVGHEDAPAVEASVVPSIGNTRLHLIIVGLWLCLFVSAMDTTIITTALFRISSDFYALDQGPWLVTAYLLAYNSFLMITAKLSDVWGLRTILLAFNGFFLVFSMACSAAQTMNQLIVFRALQGIGGSALYSLVFVAIMKLIVPDKIAFYSGIISSVFALANLSGPLLGGAISDHTNWRLIFWLNGPIIGIAMAILLFTMPSMNDNKSTRERLRGFDVIGGVLSVCWPVPLLFALQEAGVSYDWNSGIIIGTLVTAFVLLTLFIAYEAWASYKTKLDVIFPARFVTNPAPALLLFSMFLLGMPFMSMFVQLPQRFQGVNFASAERAGILLLPVSLTTPVGAVLGGLLNKKLPAEYILLLGTAIISIGIGLLSNLPVDNGIADATYGYEIITGVGLGLASTPYYIMLYTSVEEKDVPIGTGILNMLRTLGGAVAVAICSTLHNSVLRDDLSVFLNAEQVAGVKASGAFIARLPEQARIELGRVFGRSYNKQFKVIMAFALLNFLVAIALAVVRKKNGIFGKMPVRTLENEFTKTDREHEGEKEQTAMAAAAESTQETEAPTQQQNKS